MGRRKSMSEGLKNKFKPYAMFLIVLIGSLFFSFNVSGDEFGSIPDGIRLYNQHCAGCHLSFENTLVGGRSLARIRSAIKNIAQMEYLSDLPAYEMESIVKALQNSGN